MVSFTKIKNKIRNKILLRLLEGYSGHIRKNESKWKSVSDEEKASVTNLIRYVRYRIREGL